MSDNWQSQPRFDALYTITEDDSVLLAHLTRDTGAQSGDEAMHYALIAYRNIVYGGDDAYRNRGGPLSKGLPK